MFRIIFIHIVLDMLQSLWNWHQIITDDSFRLLHNSPFVTYLVLISFLLTSFFFKKIMSILLLLWIRLDWLNIHQNDNVWWFYILVYLVIYKFFLVCLWTRNSSSYSIFIRCIPYINTCFDWCVYVWQTFYLSIILDINIYVWPFLFKHVRNTKIMNLKNLLISGMESKKPSCQRLFFYSIYNYNWLRVHFKQSKHLLQKTYVSCYFGLK